MAVLDSVPGVEVTVCIDGNPVQEYVDDSEVITGPGADKTVVKWIEAISGASFTVRYRVLQEYKHGENLSFELLVDGKGLPSNRLYNAQSELGPPITSQNEGFVEKVTGSHKVIRKFEFAAISLDDDSNTAATGFGEIVVRIYRCKIEFKKTTADAKATLRKGLRDFTGVPLRFAEEALKGKSLTHGTLMGRDTIEEPISVCKTRKLDSAEDPFMKFVFRYRSKDALQKLLIIPTQGIPEPLDVKSNQTSADVSPSRPAGVKHEAEEEPAASLEPAHVQRQVALGHGRPTVKHQHEQPASPPREQPPDQFADMTVEEIEEDVRRLEQIARRKQAVERLRQLREELGPDSSGSGPNVKLDLGGRVKRVRNDDGGAGVKAGPSRGAKRPNQTIDLTDD